MDCSISVLFLMLGATVAHAALTPYDYWKTTLPNTPMPAAVRELLRPDVGVGMEVLANAHTSSAGGKDATVDFRYGCSRFTYKVYFRSRCRPPMNRMPDETIFFLEKELHLGAKMKLDFTRSSPAAAFIPRGEVSTIPFTTEKLPAILSHFSVVPESTGAEIMEETLQYCEVKDPAEKIKYCTTSLESMVDFTTSTLRTRDVWAFSSEFAKEGARKQNYIVASSPMGKLTRSDNIACHPRSYPYAVFYCHVTPATRVYVVPLVGEDGAKVDAVAVCHTDTSAWSAGHLAFQLLKVKPGAVTICHFLSEGGILWARRQ